jgi:hypothetical protein
VLGSVTVAADTSQTLVEYGTTTVLGAHAGKSVTSRKTGSLAIRIQAPVRKHR